MNSPQVGTGDVYIAFTSDTSTGEAGFRIRYSSKLLVILAKRDCFRGSFLSWWTLTEFWSDGNSISNVNVFSRLNSLECIDFTQPRPF